MKIIDVIIIAIMIYASYKDVKTREISDKVHIAIIILSLLNLNLNFNMVVGLIIVPLPYLIQGIKYGGIGGGDIKFMGALGFHLGILKGTYAGIIGLTISVVIVSIISRRKKEKNMSYPLIPYLTVGAIMMMMI